MYIAWYGLGRSFIEGLRTDSLVIGSIRVSQALAVICVVTAVILLIVIGSKVKRMGTDYKLYADTEESKRILREAEEERQLRNRKKEKTEAPAEIAEESENTEETETSSENENNDTDTAEADKKEED